MGNKIKLVIIGIAVLTVPIVWSIAANAAAHLTVQSVTVVDKSTNVVAENPTVSGNTVASTVVFHVLDDYVKYNLDLKNTTGTSFKILDITDDNSSELVEYSYDNHTDEVIDTGESLNLELTITYIQQHLDNSDRTLNNNVTFTISYLDLHTGNVDEDEIILVPNTGENTNAAASAKSVPGAAIVVAVFAGFVFVIAVLRKKKTAAVVSAIVIASTTAISVLSIGVVAEDYADLNINMNSEIRLRDYFYGEIFWKDPMTGEDAHITAEEFGADYYDADDIIYFGDYFSLSVPAPHNMEVVGFRFTGTDIDVDLEAPILDDWSVTLLYEEATYSIDYDYNGGTVATANPASVKASDASFTLVNPTKNTASFKCWTGTDIYGCEESVTVDPSQVYSDLSFTANYQHEIIVNDQNGTEIDRRIVDEGTVGAYPSFDFHTDMFKITGGSCTNGQQIITTNNSYEINNITSNAVCTITTVPITYDVELVVNNGSGSGTVTVNKGTNATFENLVADDQYVFTPNVSCTNGQTASISNGTVTVNNVTGDTTCTVNALLPSLHTITYMQEMTPQICTNTTTPNGSLATAGNDDWDGSHYGDSNYIPRKVLLDSRDNKKYLVAKLADGECWMTQNLALELSTSKALTSADTDLNTKDSWTPNRNTENMNIYSSPYGTRQQTGNMDLSFYHTTTTGVRRYYINGDGGALAPTDTTDEYLWEDPGIAYMFRAASTSDYAYDSGGYNVHLYNSICPKGWSLPEGEYVLGDKNTVLSSSPKSFGALLDAYSPNRTQQEYVAFIKSGIFKVVYNGYFQPHDPWLNYDMIYATYWSNYMADYNQWNNYNAAARVSRMNDGSVSPYSPGSGSILNTGTVRCVAR